jgi:serine/threonine protein kinase
LPEEEVAKIMSKVFLALTFMHNTKNVIHRDIKPMNIMLTEKDSIDEVVVIDFGFAIEYKQKNLHDFSRCGTVLY